MLADLPSHERRLIYWLLPEDKPFYAGIRSWLDELELSRNAEGQLEFGRFDDELSDTIAIGEIDHPPASISLRMDEAYEGALLSIPVVGPDTQLIWTLSSWMPGDATAREIEMKDTAGVLHFVFALSPVRRVLWLHHMTSGYEQLLPVTGILVEIARLRRMPATGRLSHDSFFELVERSSDDVLMEALLEYNKRARKFDAGKVSIQSGGSERNSGFNFFRKRR